MRRIFSAFIISGLTFFFIALDQTTFAQTAESNSGEEKIWLRGDLRASDVVAHVDIKEKKFIDSIGNSADCENDKGSGYCRYLLKADVKEVFKGKSIGQTIEFYVTPDADYPKKNLLGEEIVFLVRHKDEVTEKEALFTIENSSRPVQWLDAMRKIVDSKSPIDDEDEFELYSLKAVRKQIKEADAVIYADVTSFQKTPDEIGFSASLLKATVLEVFKGDLNDGQKLEFVEDLLYRPIGNDDLGKQIIFLQKREEEGKTFYERTRYTITAVEHDILEKLRKSSKEN